MRRLWWDNWSRANKSENGLLALTQHRHYVNGIWNRISCSVQTHLCGHGFILWTRTFSSTNGRNLVASRVECGRCNNCQNPQNLFVDSSHKPWLSTEQQNRAHHCHVQPPLCSQWYFTPRSKTRLHAKERRMDKIHPASSLLGFLRLVNEQDNGVGVVVNTFKQVLYVSRATALNRDIFGKGEVGHMDVGSNPR